MIKFHISLVWEGKTTYAHAVPTELEHLRLPGFHAFYATGPWGYILTQWITGAFFTYGIHHFDIKVANTVYPTVPFQTLSLHKLITGFIRCAINAGLPIELSPKWSQFFALPANKRQEAFLPVGTATAAHFDFHLDFITSKLNQYPELREVIEGAIQHPEVAYQASTVIHTELYNREWANIPHQLKKEKNVLLFLEYQALRFLKEHCEGLQQNDVDDLYAMMKGEVNRKDLESVYAIKQHIDAHLGAPHTHYSLAKAGHTNEYVLRSVFKKVYGEAPYAYIMRMRMELAYYLITHKDDVIEDIAIECGYRTASHFGKLFKKTFGVTPGSLREK